MSGQPDHRHQHLHLNQYLTQKARRRERRVTEGHPNAIAGGTDHRHHKHHHSPQPPNHHHHRHLQLHPHNHHPAAKAEGEQRREPDKHNTITTKRTGEGASRVAAEIEIAEEQPEDRRAIEARVVAGGQCPVKSERSANSGAKWKGRRKKSKLGRGGTRGTGEEIKRSGGKGS